MHAWGRDAVAKVPLPGTPDTWIRSEAEFSTAVHTVGAPVPEFLGFEQHEGRLVSIYRRARGSLMWEGVLGSPERAEQFGADLAELQHQLAGLVPPVVLPRQGDRLRSKIRRAAAIVGPEVDGALDDVTFAAREFGRSGGLIAQAAIEVALRYKARRGADIELALSPQRAIEKAHGPRPGVIGGLAAAGSLVSGFHDVGRGSDAVCPGAHYQFVQDGVDAFDLEVFGEDSDTDGWQVHEALTLSKFF